MRVVALSAGEWARATQKAAGVYPIVMPVDRAGGELVRRALGDAELLYVNLHGLAGQPYWYGDGYATAVAADWLRARDLRGVVAFVASCFGVDDAGQPGPMVAALLDAGCSAVVAGSGLNYGGTTGPEGADALGLWFRRGLGFGWTAGRALSAAKGLLVLPSAVSLAARDARAFVLLGDQGARARRSAEDADGDGAGHRGALEQLRASPK